jgi:hypothetical protein
VVHRSRLLLLLLVVLQERLLQAAHRLARLLGCRPALGSCPAP